MRNPPITGSLLGIVVAFGLSACGGAGSGGIAEIPAPPVTPTPTPTSTPTQILNTGGVNQQFIVKGATYPATLGQIGGGAAVPPPLLGDSDQLRLRYDAASNTYEIQLPQAQTWLAIAPVAGSPGQWATAGSGVTLKTQGGDSTALLSWSGNGSFGVEAVGIATPLANVPRDGWAIYYGGLQGYSSETSGGAPGSIGGAIHLTFLFASGSLTGSVFPTLTLGQTSTLATLNFKDTIHAVGSPAFSGKFDTDLPGNNSFSGSLTGLTGFRVMGNFAFPYASPINGNSAQAAGAFTGFVREMCC